MNKIKEIVANKVAVVRRAKQLKEGDEVVMRVTRVLGVRGRKPTDGRSPLMEVEFEDGTRVQVREDDRVRVLR